jgi:hypothetical protein
LDAIGNDADLRRQALQVAHDRGVARRFGFQQHDVGAARDHARDHVTDDRPGPDQDQVVVGTDQVRQPLAVQSYVGQHHHADG